MQSVKNDMTKKNLDEETDGVVAMSQLARHLIYGDIEEASLAILGADCPTVNGFNAMDREQQIRLAAAATVAACLTGSLHPSGFIRSAETRPSPTHPEATRYRAALEKIAKCDDRIYIGEDESRELSRRLMLAVRTAEEALAEVNAPSVAVGRSRPSAEA